MPGDQILDRLTGRAVPTLPGGAALGRHLYGVGRQQLYAGGHDTSPSLPDDVTVEAIREVGRRVTTLARRGAPLAELMEISPLVDQAATRRTLGRQQLEADIDRYLPYLRAVCFRPASRLGRVDRLLPAPRVRRITQNTVMRLAAHSEDWQSLRPDGVRPVRALSPERETDLDLYENRVAAHLTDQLWRYLTMRVNQIRGVSNMFSDIQRYLEDISARPFQRSSGRLWELVVELSRQADWQAQAAARLEELEGLRMALSRLRSSPVWNGTNRRAALGTVLRTTNLFTDEERYRDVAQLWHRWMAVQTQKISDEDRHRHLQDWCGAFVSYSQMLVIRAIDELGAAATERAAIGEPVTFRYAATSFTLRFAAEGALVIEVPAGPLLRMVPIPHAFTASCDDRTVRTEIEALHTEPLAIPTVVLYPGTREERQELTFPVRLRAFEPPGMALPGPQGAPLWMIPVSPLEVDSVTRLARTLRWTVEQFRLTGYPFEVRCGPSAARAIASQVKWVSPNRSGLVLNQLPPAHEVAAARNQVVQKQDLYRPAWHGIEKAEAESLWQGIEEAVRRTQELARCPRCDTVAPQADRVFQHREDGSFRCSCVCGAGWEGRVCRACRRTYPVLDVPAGTPSSALDGDDIDRLLGLEMLAAPCAVRERVFLCPWCAACGNAQLNPNCARCRL